MPTFTRQTTFDRMDRTAVSPLSLEVPADWTGLDCTDLCQVPLPPEPGFRPQQPQSLDLSRPRPAQTSPQ